MIQCPPELEASDSVKCGEIVAWLRVFLKPHPRYGGGLKKAGSGDAVAGDSGSRLQYKNCREMLFRVSRVVELMQSLNYPL